MLIPKPNSFRARKFAVAFAAALTLSTESTAGSDTPSADPAAVAMRQSLAQRYPNTRFGAVERTPIAGIWEVWMGANVAYVTEEGRHFIFGHLYDMQTQSDLTAAKKEQANVETEAARPKISFANLPMSDAIKVVRGTGERKMAVFSDPQCPYCRQLEQQLTKVDNVTVYTFLYPIAEIHHDAFEVAQAIWCAKDRGAAWTKFMTTGASPAPAAPCDTPIDRNVALAASSGINGTPFLLFSNGTNAAGAMPAAEIERRLAGN